ncbi:MAG TPA: hypothetical protein ENN60_03390 [archaeon]|nr:hypothetical protein [archaeon]
MGIVRKILGDEKLTKTELISIKDEVRDTSDGCEENREDFQPREELTTSDLIPKGIEMFVRIEDYKQIVTQLRRLDTIVEKLEELEKAHTEIQDINDKFTEQLELALSEMEEVKEELGDKLKLPETR